MECRIIIGGDFNILDPSLDGLEGNSKLKDLCVQVENLCSNLHVDMVHIWQIRNPGVKMFFLEAKESNNTMSTRFLINT